MKKDEFLVRVMAFWVSTRKREMRKETKRKGVTMTWGKLVCVLMDGF